MRGKSFRTWFQKDSILQRKMVEAKDCSTMAVTKITNQKQTLGWGSSIRGDNNEYPSTIILLADYKGKVLLKRCSSLHSDSLRDGSESELNKVEKSKLKQFNDLSSSSSSSSRAGHKNKKAVLRYLSFKQRDKKKNNIPVIQWVMSLPNRSEVDYCTIKDKEANEKSVKSRPGWPLLLIPVPTTSLDSNSTEFETAKKKDLIVLSSRKAVNELELLGTAKSLDCRIFKYEELKVATSSFSSENLIGEGGCSSVYRGHLQGDKSVAIKVLKPYNEAWADFSLEVNIVTLLDHKSIAPLIGICLEHDLLISVYDYYPMGNLENYLHGDSSGKSIVSWELRFNVAIAVAEALNYLHNNSPQPIIHRDIKLSNILLTNDLQPKLSDFGLATRGSADLAYSEETDMAGTFGYMAPEYFMYGRLSYKIDVYAFGIVLLELLSGKRPIVEKVTKGQDSLVNWAKKLLEKEDYKALVDPKLKGNIETAQMKRIALAAKLCISQSARARPNMSQILELLNGAKDADMFVQSHTCDSNEGHEDDDIDYFLEFGSKDRLDFEILDEHNESISSPSCQDSDSISLSSVENVKTLRFKLRDFFNLRLE
ncbi:PTI1-like tyrosine-protein kinase 2 isoform X2 [Humulus lupulus]|uniref:PTI1-like tyrosine-protein kinase 2 isoform X2 n=1 Tax=Humulus lupulus TaxID=3486 RepID=UPI002B415C39|nr:PTI1-like tyrosine-protein kinase 2 isoform X2 [Humulus lupulus]